MDATVVVLGVGGAAALVVAGGGAPAPKPTNLSPQGQVQLPNVPTPGSPVKPSPTGTFAGRKITRIGAGQGATGNATNLGSIVVVDPHTIGTYTGPAGGAAMTGAGANGDPNLNGKLDTITAAAKTAYDNLSDDAKQQGAQALNSALNLDPPLDGSEDWDTVGSVVGGALGGAAGAYIGGPIGAKIGAIVGAYLGVKLADLLSKNWDDLKNWCNNTWNDVSNAVSDAANKASDQAQSTLDDIENTVGSWF